MIMEKNRFGISIMVFVFLLSIGLPYSAMAVDMSDVSYKRVDVKQLETELENRIIEAINNHQYFYIGVTCGKAKRITTTIQALCSRNGDSATPANAVRCVNPHPKDVEVEDDHCGIKIAEVLYPDDFKTKTQVFKIEKDFLAKYFNSCKVHPFCLNRKVGEDQCGRNKGIVYLRIYKEEESLPYRPRKWRRIYD